MKTKRTLIAVLSVAMVAATAGVTLAQQGDGDVAARDENAARAGEKTALFETYGVDPRAAQRGFVTRSGKQLYFTQGARVACVTDVDGSGHCALGDRLQEGLGFGGELCRDDLPADQVRITGVLPEGVNRVTLRTADNSTWTADAQTNTVAFEVERSAVGQSVELTWTMPDGRAHTVNVPQPPVVVTARCG